MHVFHLESVNLTLQTISSQSGPRCGTNGTCCRENLRRKLENCSHSSWQPRTQNKSGRGASAFPCRPAVTRVRPRGSARSSVFAFPQTSESKHQVAMTSSRGVLLPVRKGSKKNGRTLTVTGREGVIMAAFAPRSHPLQLCLEASQGAR